MNKYKEKYYKYLKSSKWRLKRQQKFDQAGRRCEECGSLNKLHIHHLTYDRLYVERLDDLKVLCETCHMKAHGNISKEKSAKNKKRIENRVKLVKKGVVKKYDRNHYDDYVERESKTLCEECHPGCPHRRQCYKYEN